MFKINKLASVMMVAGLLAVGVTQAATVNGGLVGGLNSVLDESRESYADANGNGLFDAGDVIFGYIRISDFQPKGVPGNNQVYGVFSQQIMAGSAGRNVIFGATTVAGLTLKDLLGGDANVNASAVAAFYDRPTSYTDLINNNPPGPPASMGGYLDYIRTNGTLRLVAGFDQADDFLFSEITLQAATLGMAVGGANAIFANPALNSGYTVAGNFGGFTFSYNNTDFTFDEVQTYNPVTGLFVNADIIISSGTTSGANGANTLPSPTNWKEAGGAFAQCGTPAGDVACGFQNKNDFLVNVAVPEPGSLALTSLALIALGGLARRKSKSA